LQDRFFNDTLNYLSNDPLGKYDNNKGIIKDEIELFLSLKRKIEDCRSNFEVRQRCNHMLFIKQYIEIRIDMLDLMEEEDDTRKRSKQQKIGKGLEELVVNYCEKIPELFVYVLGFMIGHSDYVELSFGQTTEMIKCLNAVGMAVGVKKLELPLDWGSFYRVSRSFLYSKLKNARIE